MRFESNFLPKCVKGGLHQNKCFLVITILQAGKIARNNEYDYCGYIRLSFKTRIRRMLTQIRRIRLSGSDSADSVDSTDLVDSTDSANSANSTDSADLADSYFNPHLDRLGCF